MKPNTEHVKPLEEFDADAFADWLRRGFEDIYFEPRKLTAFAPLNYFVNRRGDLTGELRDIYDILSGTAQKDFRSGIAIALSNLPPTFRSVPIARGLLHLAGRVYAPEILPIAIQQIGNGFFGMPEDDAGREIFALTLDIIAGMSPSHNVGYVVRRLVASSFFQVDYAPRAFIALCHAEPERFPEHLDLLRSSFAELHKKAGLDGTDITARRFAQYVDVAVIAHNLYHVFLSQDPSVFPYLNTDNWFGDALFLCSNSPFYLIMRGGSFLIARRQQEAIEQTWEIELEGLPAWDRVYEVRKFLMHCLESNRLEPWTQVEKEVNVTFFVKDWSLFHEDEFTKEHPIEALCNVLMNDDLAEECGTVSDLNELLDHPNLYNNIKEKTGQETSERLAKDMAFYDPMRIKNMRAFNRTVLEKVYPNETPKCQQSEIFLRELELLGIMKNEDSPLFPEMSNKGATGVKEKIV